MTSPILTNENKCSSREQFKSCFYAAQALMDIGQPLDIVKPLLFNFLVCVSSFTPVSLDSDCSWAVEKHIIAALDMKGLLVLYSIQGFR